MFERNRIDNSLQHSAVPVELTLASGEIRKGKFVITSSRAIQDVINGDGQFLEFETYDGDRALLAKSTISEIRLIAVPAAASLQARAREIEGFNPYAVLGVAPGAAWDEVRQAYLALSKMYHPDCYAGASLPREVRDYLSAMARRINAAYGALEAPHVAAKTAIQEKSKPVFTSPQRAF